MAIKSSNVAARVEPDIKEKAEEILSKLGISADEFFSSLKEEVLKSYV